MADTIDVVEEPIACKKENLPVSLEDLEFQLIRVAGKELAPKDIGGKSDPYIKVGYIGEQNNVVLDKKKGSLGEGGVFYRSGVTNKSLSFVCDDIPDDKRPLRRFTIEIWDKDSMSADDWMGSRTLNPQEIVDAWFSDCKTWTRLVETSPELTLKVEQGAKSGKVKGSLTIKITILHKKITELAEKEEKYNIYKNKIRLEECHNNRKIEETKKKEEEQKKEHDRRKKKEEEERIKKEKKEKHVEALPGLFQEVKSAESLLKFLDKHTGARAWSSGEEPWQSSASSLTKDEVIQLVGKPAIFRVLSFVLEEEVREGLVAVCVGYVSGLMCLVEFSELPEISQIVNKLFETWKKNEKKDQTTSQNINNINEKLLLNMPNDEHLLKIKQHFKNLIFSPEEAQALLIGFKPKEKFSEDTEVLRRMSKIIWNHLDNWKPEHQTVLEGLFTFLRSRILENKENPDYWEEVAMLCVDLEKLKHAGVDKAMQNKDAFVIVDGVGLHQRLLHTAQSRLFPLKEIYSDNGRWYFPGAKAYTYGGWEFIKERK